MNDDVIVFSDLEIVTKSGDFYYQIGLGSSRVIKTDEEVFKNVLVSAAHLYHKNKTKYGENSPRTEKAYRLYKFYEDQIDITKGDMFTALLYPFDKWVAVIN